MYNCLICGVGGQGTVVASRIIAQAAMEKGLFARTAETIGMAQRGGSVVSHVRVGAEAKSPLIPLYQADVLAGFEPGEAVRQFKYLSPEGLAVVSDSPVNPVTAALSGAEYNAGEMIEFLKSNARELRIIDARRIFAECGSTRVLNVAILGAVAASGRLPIDIADVERAIKSRLKPAFIETNMKALYMGARGEVL